MPEYLDDPSVLTKDKLKSELLAHNVELPSGNPNKDVYVQLYLKNLTAQNKMSVPASTLDAFSSDEELPPPVVSSRSRSSGRKATRKTDKVQPDELDVTVLTDEGLRGELLKHGVDVGPIVASTRKLYEKKLQKLLDDGPTPPLEPKLPQLVLTDIQVNHNGKSDSDLYSDKEDEVTEIPEPEPEPEPAPAPAPAPALVPVVERPVRSRGKTPVTTRTRSSQHHTMVPEHLRPILTDPVQLESNRRVHHKSDSPARAERRSSSSRCVQIHREELGPVFPRHSEDSSDRPVALLNTALLEDPEPKIPQLAARPSSPLVHLTRVEPNTFSPMCKISPIKRPESPWTGSDRSGSEASGVSAAVGECGPPDVPPHKQRQQKITGFLSARSQVKAQLHEDVSVEKITASDQNPKVDDSNVLKELFTNDISSPTGITATCRRPIRGAAGRPVKPSDLWNSENCLFSPKVTKTSSSSSSYTESRVVNRVAGLPRFTASTSSLSNSSSRSLSAAPPAAQTKAVRRGMSLWIKLFLLAIVAAFLFLVYQAMETNSISPFETSDTEVTSGSTA